MSIYKVHWRCRYEPYHEDDRYPKPEPHEGFPVRGPVAIEHSFPRSVGRSTGGFHHLSKSHTMVWKFDYMTFEEYDLWCVYFKPHVPWIYLYYPDYMSGEFMWVEAVMTEPVVGRTVGTVMQNISIEFQKVMYVPD